jgi:IMP cyclohydrolase
MIDVLKGKRYPGRFIALGMDNGAYVAVYGATGRSPSSLARRFYEQEGGVYMGGIDDTVHTHHTPELLEYPALKFFTNGVAVANGRQIEHITSIENRDARKQLSYALSEEAYEPDEYNTPRITGLVSFASAVPELALHIARIAPDGIDRSSWQVSLEEGKGMFISTYIGDDVKPTPSFAGNPLPVVLQFGDEKKAARAVFDALTPPKGETDYRVGCIAVYIKNGETKTAIVNNK